MLSSEVCISLPHLHVCEHHFVHVLTALWGEKRVWNLELVPGRTVGSFSLRAKPSWPVALFWTPRYPLQSEASATGGGSRDLQGEEATNAGTRMAVSSVHELMPSTARKPPGGLFPASSLLCWVCKRFERGRLGPAWKPLLPFMIGTACEEKLSFFPRVCGTSFTGTACCWAKAYHERDCDVPVCGAPDLQEGRALQACSL